MTKEAWVDFINSADNPEQRWARKTLAFPYLYGNRNIAAVELSSEAEAIKLMDDFKRCFKEIEQWTLNI